MFKVLAGSKIRFRKFTVARNGLSEATTELVLREIVRPDGALYKMVHHFLVRYIFKIFQDWCTI